jgi:two-component system response regulator FlrC
MIDMPRKRHKPEEIVTKLRQVDVLVSQGSTNIPPGPLNAGRTAAEQVTRNLVGRTVAEVERDLILETLKHCLGNRTHAANILGISIRTLRNKLNEYAADGAPITPAGGGELRGAA